MLKKLYLREVRDELNKYSLDKDEVITENDISALPEPVQRYFRYCGFIGQVKMINAEIEWENTYIKRDPEGQWLSIECHQFNSVPEPTRIFYLKSRILGIFPFEARDIYQNGKGNMLIKALKFIKVVDAKGKEMDESSLVTLLSEFLMVPTYALHDYVTWTAVDSNTAKAVIDYNGSKISGFFYFNEKGECIRFESNDRYYTPDGKDPKNYKWSIVIDGYTEQNGTKIPSDFRVIWEMENRDFEYFKGTISDIQFNINTI